MTFFPSDEITISLFITHLHNMNNSYGTICTVLSGVSYYHKLKGLKDPCKSFLSKQILAAIGKKGCVADRRKPITIEILSQLMSALANLGLPHSEVLLFKGIFLTAFHFALRISEYTKSQHTLTIDNLCISANSMSLNFSSFKHSSTDTLLSHKFQAIDPQDPISNLCPVKAMANYIELRGLGKGPLFMLGGKAVPRKFFAKILRQAIVNIRLSPTCYTSHSFRIGATTWWADQGVAEDEIRRRGRWRNASTYQVYVRGSVSHNT